MMQIVGTGLDATEIARIEETLERFGDRFVRRVFTDAEIAYCNGRPRRRASHFAARFAAKEATMKALGTGHSRGVLWRDVEILRTGGPPQLRLHGGAARRAATLRVTSTFLTLTHSDTVALAHVLLLADG